VQIENFIFPIFIFQLFYTFFERGRGESMKEKRALFFRETPKVSFLLTLFERKIISIRMNCNLGEHKEFGIAAIIFFIAISVCYSVKPVSVLGVGSSPDPYYSSDGFTLLFDNFEDTTLADSVASSVSYDSGYLSGRSLLFSDTNSYALYSDSWWTDPGEQVSAGTVEMYYRPDTFVYTSDQSYELLFTMDERPNAATGGGYPSLSVLEDGNLNWAISRSPGQYAEADYPTETDSPFLYPGQWYHIAATWSAGIINLYVNGLLAATADFDTYVLAEEFQLGSRDLSITKGLSARGKIDRFRLSSVARSASQFPSCLDIRIDTPLSAPGGVNLAKPFVVKARAYASDTRTRKLDIYADSNATGFDGTLLAENLPESGSFLLGAGLSDTTWYLYAVARAGSDSAFYYYPFPFILSASQNYANVLDPSDTAASFSIAPSSSESFTIILLNQGGTVDSPPASVDTTGAGANYSIATRLLEPTDTAVFYIWTKEPAGAVSISVRTDSQHLNAPFMPRGISNSETGIKAFSRTIISTEFFGSDGKMIGDTATTSWIGDTFAYNIEYRLSKQTAALFRELGFDTSAGSKSFAFFYADTYGAIWFEDPNVIVSVSAGSLGGIIVRCSGITKDLPGGLGLANPTGTSYITSVDHAGTCILERIGAPEPLLILFRFLRDVLMNNLIGRLMIGFYYLL